MRRRTTTGLTALALLALAGCGSQEAPTEPAASAPSPTAPVPGSSGLTTATPSPRPSVEPLPDDVLARLTLTGGMCAEDDCDYVLSVRDDGSWTVDGGPTPDASGTLSAADLTDLEAAVADTGLASAPPFAGTCPTAYDGREMLVAWQADTGPETVSSCRLDLPEDDPLLVALHAVDDASAQTDPPAGPVLPEGSPG